MPAPPPPASPPNPARARVRRAAAEVGRVQRELDAWLQRRRAEDARQPFPRFVGQLAALETALDAALERIRAEVAALQAAPPPAGRAFAACALQDLRLAWVQRLWFYFRHKLDQRDDPALAPVLNAADEVIWSCYKPAFQQEPGLQRTAPLPYLEPLFSPHAILRDDPPRELLWNADDAFARSCLAALPIPVIGVPASTVGAPWLLALLAHEVGHHVQADYDGGGSTRAREFGDALRQGAQGAAQPQAWEARGREVFADTFSVLAIGAATRPVITELILTDEPRMLRSGDLRYPAPAVRLALLGEIERRLGLAATAGAPGRAVEASTSAGPDPAAAAVADEIGRLPPIVAAALAWRGPGGLAFPELLGWNRPASDGEAWRHVALQGQGDQAGWAATLAADQEPVVLPSLDSPRLLAGAGALAWAELVGEADDQRREDMLAALAARIVNGIPPAREQATRAAGNLAAAAGSALADRLMAAGAEELASTSPAAGRALPLP